MQEVVAAEPDESLVVYGSLAPGGPNHFILSGLEGDWYPCVIQGRMGVQRGFKTFRWDPQGPEHAAWLLHSPALPEKFPELDDFESEEYRRVLIPARVGDNWVIANVYEGRYGEE